MLKRKNKKGFTLAELLIVVAILAVLVAIAVPLFVGALNDAEQRTLDANKRAVKSAGVAYVLQHTSTLDISTVDDKANWLLATGTLTEQGDITNITVTIVPTTKPEETDLTAWKANKTEIKVILEKTNFGS